MKKIFLFILFLGLAACSWYLFFKEYDYQIRMQGSYGPGSVYQEIIDLQQLNTNDSLIQVRTMSTEPYHEILQHVALRNADSLALLWQFERKNDSVTRISVHARNLSQSVNHRLAILNPFAEDANIAILKEDLRSLQKHLNSFQQTYRINPTGITESPSGVCACVTNTSTVKGKANAMKASIGQLENFLAVHRISQIDYPIVQVLDWNQATDSIQFDFCFPLNKKPKNAPKGDVFIKEIASRKALSARFNGNYALSHRAWYDLYEQAKEEGYELNMHPTEVFKNNPKNGGIPITWEAQIYLPVEK